MSRLTNLLTELTRVGLTQKELAQKIGMRPETLSKKILLKSDFTYPEILKIRNVINKDLKIEYLFEIEG